jgi:hypothetical protein
MVSSVVKFYCILCEMKLFALFIKIGTGGIRYTFRPIKIITEFFFKINFDVTFPCMPSLPKLLLTALFIPSSRLYFFITFLVPVLGIAC